MRIVLLNDRIPPENRGGAGQMVWRLACGLHRAGHEVHIIAATKQASFDEVREGIATYHVHSRYPQRWRAWLSLYNPQTIPALQALYQEIQPDVINAHNIHTDLSYYCLTLAHGMGIPVVFTSHDVMLFAYHKLSYFIEPSRCGVDSPNAYRLPPFYNLRTMRFQYNPLRNLLIRSILRNHAQIRVAPSQELCNAHHANGLPEFQAVYNGIDSAQFTASGAVIQQLHERLNLQGRKIILFAGRLTGAKGTYPLLKVLMRVVEAVPEALLLVLSPQSLESQIEAAQYAHLFEHHIRSAGWLEGKELVAAFHLADVVVVPSVIFDTFPTVNLEAMAAKKPVLASCYGGSYEAVLDAVTGYVINPFDYDDFTQKLVRLLRDEGLREQMGAAAYARVQTHFTLGHYVQQMLDSYQQAIEAT